MRLTAIVHAAAVLLLLADIVVGMVDVLTLVAILIAVATVGVYVPDRKEV